MTNEEYIRNRCDTFYLATRLVQTVPRDRYNGAGVRTGREFKHITSDGTIYNEQQYAEAILHEVDWLKQQKMM